MIRRQISRGAVALRVLAAAVGGYGLSAVVAVFCGMALTVPRAEAVTTGILVSFAVMPAAIMWAFAARSVLRAWLGLLVPAALLAAWTWFHSIGTSSMGAGG